MCGRNHELVTGFFDVAIRERVLANVLLAGQCCLSHFQVKIRCVVFKFARSSGRLSVCIQLLKSFDFRVLPIPLSQFRSSLDECFSFYPEAPQWSAL